MLFVSHSHRVTVCLSFTFLKVSTTNDNAKTCEGCNVSDQNGCYRKLNLSSPLFEKHIEINLLRRSTNFCSWIPNNVLLMILARDLLWRSKLFFEVAAELV